MITMGFGAMCTVLTIPFILSQAVKDCPPKDNILPCTCEKDFYQVIRVKCDDEDINKLYGAIDVLSETNLQIDVLLFYHKKAIVLRSNLFGNLKIKDLTIIMPKLKTINYYSLISLNYSIESFTIDYASLSQIPIFAIKSFAIIEEFQVSFCKNIEVIQAHLFEPIKGSHLIRRVAFTDNAISIVERNAFIDLKVVEMIDLRQNKLSFIDSRSFPTKNFLTSLKIFELWHNNLTRIPYDVIENLAEGSTLNLYRNRIKEISSNEMKLMIQKRIDVNLNDNELNCGCSFLLLAQANEEGFKLIEGKCKKPESLKDKDLKTLQQNDFEQCM